MVVVPGMVTENGSEEEVLGGSTRGMSDYG